MTEKKLKTQQGFLVLRVPSRLDEITLGQLIQMQEKTDMDDLGAISILSGISKTTLKNISDYRDLEVFARQINSLAYQITHLYSTDVIPASVTFTLNEKKVKVNVIKSLSLEPAGAFMASREIIAEEIAEHIKQHGEENWQGSFNPRLKACAQVLGQYFYCRATGNQYQDQEAAAFENAAKELPITDALPIARYFFLSYPNLLKLKISIWRRLQMHWSKKLALKRLKAFAISTP